MALSFEAGIVKFTDDFRVVIRADRDEGDWRSYSAAYFLETQDRSSPNFGRYIEMPLDFQIGEFEKTININVAGTQGHDKIQIWKRKRLCKMEFEDMTLDCIGEFKQEDKKNLKSLPEWAIIKQSSSALLFMPDIDDVLHWTDSGTYYLDIATSGLDGECASFLLQDHSSGTGTGQMRAIVGGRAVARFNLDGNGQGKTYTVRVQDDSGNDMTTKTLGAAESSSPHTPSSPCMM